MSKNKPTLCNVPYYYGTCKSFLRIFSRTSREWLAGGNLMAETWRQENGSIGDLIKSEVVQGEEVLTGLTR
jgi:hypothetical protein